MRDIMKIVESVVDEDRFEDSTNPESPYHDPDHPGVRDNKAEMIKEILADQGLEHLRRDPNVIRAMRAAFSRGYVDGWNAHRPRD